MVEKLNEVAKEQVILKQEFHKMINLQKEILKKLDNIAQECSDISDKIEEEDVSEYKVFCEANNFSIEVFYELQIASIQAGHFESLKECDTLKYAIICKHVMYHVTHYSAISNGYHTTLLGKWTSSALVPKMFEL